MLAGVFAWQCLHLLLPEQLLQTAIRQTGSTIVDSATMIAARFASNSKSNATLLFAQCLDQVAKCGNLFLRSSHVYSRWMDSLVVVLAGFQGKFAEYIWPWNMMITYSKPRVNNHCLDTWVFRTLSMWKVHNLHGLPVRVANPELSFIYDATGLWVVKYATGTWQSIYIYSSLISSSDEEYVARLQPKLPDRDQVVWCTYRQVEETLSLILLVSQGVWHHM